MSKTRKILSLVLITSLTVSSLFFGSTGSIEAKTKSEESNWTKWLQKNAYKIKQLSPSENDTYQDLRFLKKVLKDKQIVLLGESSHGAAEFNSSKVRLIQYLHKELDYDVVAFESGLGEAYATDLNVKKQTPLQTMQDSIFSIWHAQETLPLFDYIQRERQTNDPLSLSGFDMQPTNTSYSHFLKSWFEKVDPSMGEKAYQSEMEFLYYFSGLKTIDQFQQDKARMIANYQSLLTFLKEHQDELTKLDPEHPERVKVTQHVLEDRINSIDKIVEKILLIAKYSEENPVEALKYYDELSVLRDEAMAKNLTWLAEELYPNKKIIVWAHNIHIRKVNTQTENPNRTNVVTMGQLMPDRLKKKSYVIGLYMNKGVSALNNQQPAPVRYPHPEGNIESILSKSKHPNLFVDLQHQKNKKGTSWMFTRRQAMDWGLWDEQLVPRDQYDGILFIDEVHIPTYINPIGQSIQSKKQPDIQSIIRDRLNNPPIYSQK
ncbi:erythromycin esterase family protein [Risungbinella massiliensis]|uniref:erythromycin esterase family protein n=1 Tax=Risungbinella massiliensis TaxID=1329796 RepID=UPI00069BDDCE|nr:erythromycin esterase family protein [Risungbinella massiliensis]